MQKLAYLFFAAFLLVPTGCVVWEQAALTVGPTEARRAVRESWERVDSASRYCPTFEPTLYAPFAPATSFQKKAEAELAQGSFRSAYRFARRAERAAAEAQDRAIAYRARQFAEARGTAIGAIEVARHAIATATVNPMAAPERVQAAVQWVARATFELAESDFPEGRMFAELARKEAVESLSPQPSKTQTATVTATVTPTATATPTIGRQRK